MIVSIRPDVAQRPPDVPDDANAEAMANVFRLP